MGGQGGWKELKDVRECIANASLVIKSEVKIFILLHDWAYLFYYTAFDLCYLWILSC